MRLKRTQDKMGLFKKIKKQNKNDLNSLLKVILAFGGVYSFSVGLEHFFGTPILTTVIVLAAAIVLIYISNFLYAVKEYIMDYFRFEKRIRKLEKEVEKFKDKKK